MDEIKQWMGRNAYNWRRWQRAESPEDEDGYQLSSSRRSTNELLTFIHSFRSNWNCPLQCTSIQVGIHRFCRDPPIISIIATSAPLIRSRLWRYINLFTYLLTYLLRKPVLVMQQEFKLILKYSHTHIVYINEISPSRDEKLSTTLALQARNIKYTCQDVEAN